MIEFIAGMITMLVLQAGISITYLYLSGWWD